MICDNCKKNEAVISFTKIVGEDISEIHLCSQCAEKKLKGEGFFNVFMNDRVKGFLQDIFKFRGGSEDQMEIKECRNCGSTLGQVMEETCVGCESCYDEFRPDVERFLKNLQNSWTHKGKMPINISEDLKLRRHEMDLNDKLNMAVSLESYEEAAKIRDEIKALRGKK